MKEIIFKGCGTAIITPFTDAGVNFEEFRKMIEFQINEGVDSIVVCGTTGESSTMTKEEKLYNDIVEYSNSHFREIINTVRYMINGYYKIIFKK